MQHFRTQLSQEKWKWRMAKNCFRYRNIDMPFIDIGRMVGVWVGGILCKGDQEPHIVFLYISDKNGTSKLRKLPFLIKNGTFGTQWQSLISTREGSNIFWWKSELNGSPKNWHLTKMLSINWLKAATFATPGQPFSSNLPSSRPRTQNCPDIPSHGEPKPILDHFISL